MVIRIFKCSQCGMTFPASKTKGVSHYGHLKHMYCYKCKKETPCVQVDADGHIPVGGKIWDSEK